VDSASIRASGANAGIAAAPASPAANAGTASISALNTKGVAMVTPLPASMSDADATTRRLMAAARSLLFDASAKSSSATTSSMEGRGGQTCRASSLAMRQFLRPLDATSMNSPRSWAVAADGGVAAPRAVALAFRLRAVC